MKSIDLNCDMGESFGIWRMGADAEVMPWVSSVNIACGAHAGDPLTMQRTLRAAAAARVAVGAHVGLPDLVGFGRRAMAITPRELYAMTITQMGALHAMATCCGVTPDHIKPHGALYHMLENDRALAQAMVDAVRDLDSSLRVYGLAGGTLVQVAQASGLAVAGEAFADRRYRDDGHLQARGEAGAVLEDVDAVVQQALDIVVHGHATTANGEHLAVHAETLCVHGDRADAAAFAKALHEGLADAGVQVAPPTSPALLLLL